jgi:hypothetical protein
MTIVLIGVGCLQHPSTLTALTNQADKRSGVKTVVDKYIADCQHDDIERIVDQAIKDITKQEILAKL